ncbi:MAG TPA: YdeI/OmpD-associated family protein [Vicinamibacterales bacterium]|nr:YdeI/OmpD-associated family protein [Vicinamibacterales bacterium]
MNREKGRNVSSRARVHTRSNVKPTYFRSASEFRKWLDEHHASEVELWVGYHKKGTGVASMTWQESVDEALCFGWIDGIRKSIDESRYTIRFTPRRSGSNWSKINIERINELTKLGRMTTAGLKAFEQRNTKLDYSYEETRQRQFSPEQQQTFRANPKAWAFFEKQPPSYRKTLIYWVTSAKKEETRASRLKKLIIASAAGRRLGDSFTDRKKTTVPPTRRKASSRSRV